MTNMTGEMGTEISTEVSGNDSRSLPYYVSWKSPPLAWTCLVSRARLENNEAPDTDAYEYTMGEHRAAAKKYGRP